MKLSRLASVDHPLALQFQRAFESLTAGLQWDSARPYRGTVRNFLIYLGDNHPAVSSLDQLCPDPHILGWFAHLRSQIPPLAPAVYINRLTQLRCILEELAWTAPLPQLARLIRREDFPRPPQRLPRALTTQQDQLIQQELLHRNDVPANIFLLLRHTGMRIGECVDLSYDCLGNVGPDRWAIHVPLGKFKTERMVPVDAFVCELVQRLRFFRSFDPLPPDPWLLSRPDGKQALIRQLRYCLHEVTAAAGITTRIVPHQLRHTYASEMIRSSVTLPALMKLLGHADPEMTMRYVDVTSSDLQREYHLAPREASTSNSTTESANNFAPRRPGRRHRLSALRSTCHRDVPSIPVKWPSATLPRSTFESSHQNPLPSSQTQPRRIAGRDWPY